MDYRIHLDISFMTRSGHRLLQSPSKLVLVKLPLETTSAELSGHWPIFTHVDLNVCAGWFLCSLMEYSLQTWHVYWQLPVFLSRPCCEFDLDSSAVVGLWTPTLIIYTSESERPCQIIWCNNRKIYVTCILMRKMPIALYRPLLDNLSGNSQGIWII